MEATVTYTIHALEGQFHIKGDLQNELTEESLIELIQKHIQDVENTVDINVVYTDGEGNVVKSVTTVAEED